MTVKIPVRVYLHVQQRNSRPSRALRRIAETARREARSRTPGKVGPLINAALDPIRDITVRMFASIKTLLKINAHFGDLKG